VALPFTLKKSIFKEKEELRKLKKYFTMQKKKKKNLQKNLQKNQLKRNQIPSTYYKNSVTNNPKFQHKPKYGSFKNPHIKINK
jgi:hypothetical protein